MRTAWGESDRDCDPGSLWHQARRGPGHRIIAEVQRRLRAQVGVKTAACVLAFSMERAAFPVDTHVHRVVTRLGWISAGTTAEQAYRVLAPRVPAGIRCDLHLALIRHGRMP
jgi:endonuclease III-like uncharacterized protein